jgi:tryptophanase
VQYPPGGSAVFLNATEFAKHLPKEQFRAWSTLAALFVSTGISSSEIGVIAAGKDLSGNFIYPETEWVRLILPRLVYTDEQIDYLADLITDFWERRTELIKGLRLEYYPEDPESLLAFFVRFSEVE